MTEDFILFLSQSENDRRDAFVNAADHLETSSKNVEKDFWVCLVLDFLFSPLLGGHPRLLFKGGTSLSKAYGLINRFSEDIDIVVFREDLGFGGDRDPTVADHLSNRKRRALFDELRAVCSSYICEDLQSALAKWIDDIVAGCQVVPDESDVDGQTLFLDYQSILPTSGTAYVAPRVKIEAGARSALNPSRYRTLVPYVADIIPDWSSESGNLRVFAPERTYLDKLMILHGAHCGFRDVGRLPREGQRISRHYYDVAMMTKTKAGQSALNDIELLDSVRNHNLVAYRQAWKRLDEAVPGSLRLVPQPELLAVIEKDYEDMKEMIFGDAPGFGWIMDQLRFAETVINEPQVEPLGN